MNKKNIFRFKIVITTMIIAAVTIFVSPIVVNLANQFFPKYPFFAFILMVMLLTCLCSIIFIMKQTFHLLLSTKKDRLTSDNIVEKMNQIKHTSIFLSTLYTMLLPLSYILAEKDDAPGLILIFLVLLLLSLYIIKITLKKLKRNQVVD
ncbi:DUF2975 domain-containing protein [Carnobacterium sp. FSL E2-0243]|uniref:DUF2975 domain-containing protein n=1 Tax=Carnobacterium sp. FSL E2-0243 TaxID=2921365 RepID=UPI0030F53AA2